MEHVDFGQIVKSYGRSRNDIPNGLFDSLLLRNIIFEGKNVVDLGSGTGAFTKKLRFRRANVIGVEPSKILLAEAEKININELLQIQYIHGMAEQTGLESGHFDIVTAMHAWHWFNRVEVLREIKRILKRNGTLVVIDSGFISTHPITELTSSVIRKYVEGNIKPAGTKVNSKQAINGFPVEWFEEWNKFGFKLKDFYQLNYRVYFSIEEWLERVASISWLVGLKELKRNMALKELAEVLEEKIGSNATVTIPHFCTVAILNLTE